jgi:hypothetical protein
MSYQKGNHNYLSWKYPIGSKRISKINYEKIIQIIGQE